MASFPLKSGLVRDARWLACGTSPNAVSDHSNDKYSVMFEQPASQSTAFHVTHGWKCGAECIWRIGRCSTLIVAETENAGDAMSGVLVIVSSKSGKIANLVSKSEQKRRQKFRFLGFLIDHVCLLVRRQMQLWSDRLLHQARLPNGITPSLPSSTISCISHCQRR